ncbi:HNH endonuclease [Sphingobacterium sp. GVS05A]|uniref:HNH endonuclease n=1 Tax=Sphingobacterium sp. GVS05A TaxID=2862679 RepID=UPI001CBE0B06|nr:HNH endonuclease [Sphingobacterium sp. GVS05A]
MNKEEYFLKSKTSKCQTLRCPITNYCTRRALTIYFYADFKYLNYYNSEITTLIKEGIIPEDFEEKAIPLQSPVNIWKKSNIHIYYQHMCPEVNLFESEFSLPFAIDTASTDGEWDDYRNTNKFKNIYYGHFSECAEYNYYIFHNRKQKSTGQRKRSLISKSLRFEIFQRDNYTCQYCGRTPQDGAKLSLDHKIAYSDGGKDTYENLITACMDCNMGKGNKVI